MTPKTEATVGKALMSAARRYMEWANDPASDDAHRAQWRDELERVLAAMEEIDGPTYRASVERSLAAEFQTEDTTHA